MIDAALIFLRNHLNAHLIGLAGQGVGEGEDKVVFLDGDKTDPPSFKLGAVTCLLVNIQEDKAMRAPDPFSRTTPEGAHLRVQPDVWLNLHVLFVARFQLYEHGLAYLGRIIEHFQGHRVLDHRTEPGLSPRIARLTLELMTLGFAEQNEIWSALRTTYLPSVLYRVRMVLLRDEPAIPAIGVDEGIVRVNP
ncbi:MAG: DUF4255 domain-containing protein [Nannocystaceae bacterium]